jgi:lysophospholipase L1-like esterase
VRRFVVVPLLLGAALVSSCAAVVRVPVVHRASAASRPQPFDVAFVGDSNIVRGTDATIATLRGADTRNAPRGYIPSFFAKSGVRLNPVFFAHELATPRFHPDAVILNIGINDTLKPDLYAHYGKRIDKFMALVPTWVPVLYPTYPVAIEPQVRRLGANAINRAWWIATKRWPNVRIVRWGAYADQHPEWIDRSNPAPQQRVHYTPAGYDALARFELNVLKHLA